MVFSCQKSKSDQLERVGEVERAWPGEIVKLEQNRMQKIGAELEGNFKKSIINR